MSRAGALLFLHLCFVSTLLLSNETYFFEELHLRGNDEFIGVNCIEEGFQHGDNFVWLGSKDGLFRYDGHSFYEVPTRKKGLKITALASGRDMIWAGTSDGEIYLLKGDSLVPLSTPSPITDDPITGIVVTPTKTWLASSSAGLWLLEADSWTRYAPDEIEEVYSLSAQITIGYHNLTEKLYVGTLNGLHVITQDSSWKIKKPDLKDEIVRSASEFNNGMDVNANLWVTYDQNGFSRLPSAHFLTNESYGAVTDVYPTHHKIFVATEEAGLLVLERAATFRSTLSSTGVQSSDSITSIAVIEEFRGAKIYDLHMSSSGKLFIASNKGDLFVGRPSFSKLGNIDGNVQALCAESNTEAIWLAKSNGVFRYLNGTLEKLEQLPDNTFVTTLFYDKDLYNNERLWIGTFDKGLFCYSDGKLKNFTDSDGLSNNSILSITGTGLGGSIFAGTFDGITRITTAQSSYKLEQLSSETSSESGRSAANYIYHLHLDKGVLWAATDGHGVFKLEGDQLKQIGKGTQLETAVVYSISSFDGGLLVNTKDQGLLLYRDGKIDTSLVSYYKDKQVLSMYDDLIIEQGRISLLDYIADSLLKFRVDLPQELATLTPRLNAIDITGEYPRSVIIGTSSGIIKITGPGRLGYLGQGKGPVILGVTDGFGNNRLNSLGKLPSRSKNLQIAYTANWHNNQDNLSFEYLLEGQQNEWQESRDRQLSFSGLRPGDYNFRLRLKEPSGIYVGEEAAYAFSIKTPIWQQWWFILLMLMLTAFLVVIGIRQRDARILKAQQLEKEQIHTQYENLRNQVNPHFLFNSFNTLTSLIEEDQEQAVDYLGKLSDFFRSILDYRGRDLISLRDELELLSDYFFLQKSRYEEKLSLELAIPEVDKSRLYIPPMSLQLLVENAIKHNIITSTKPLRISITADREKIVVANNFQPKPTKSDSTGIGLNNLSNKFALLGNGSLRVRNENGTFSVTLPLSAKREI